MKLKTTLIKGILAVLIFTPITALGKVSLPSLVSDGMILQRNAEVKIWGWAADGEQVSVVFKDSTFKTVTNKDGQWEITLSNLSAGGPYSMTIRGSNTITLNDIMVGDVWVSSGQSNMVLPMERVRPLYESEIANSENSSIRYFDVPLAYKFNAPQKN